MPRVGADHVIAVVIKRVEKRRAKVDTIKIGITVNIERRGIIKIVEEIEKRMDEERGVEVEAGVEIENVPLVIKMFNILTNNILVMMTRQLPILPPLYLTMNVKYYNNMNPNNHLPQQKETVAAVVPHLENTE